MKRSLTIAPVLFLLFGSHVFAEERLLEKVPQLQDTARRANRGQLGSGIGTVTLITSRGQVKAQSNLDPIQVFGPTIKVSDLLPLLDARAESNRTGVVNPMSGDVSDLTYVALYTLSLAKDDASIPVIVELLKDQESAIHGWSAIALYDIAKFSDQTRGKIQTVKFPKRAVDSAKARGREPPPWVQIQSDN
jgi:hypothetical protein